MAPLSLPVEILRTIISHVRPEPHVIAADARSLETRTLASCALLCRAVVADAQMALYRYCLYVDGADRLRALLASYRIPSTYGPSIDQKRDASQSIYLEPFPEDDLVQPRIVSDLTQLFRLLGHSLRRLVLDMPLRTVQSDDEGVASVRPPLHSAFEHLLSIEEIVSCSDELYLPIAGQQSGLAPQVWETWKLKCIALYNPLVERGLANALRRQPQLSQVVLVCPDFDTGHSLAEMLNILDSKVEVIIVNSWSGHLHVMRDFDLSSRVIESPDYDGARLSFICTPEGYDFQGSDFLDICQQWYKHAAIDGSLWHAERIPLSTLRNVKAALKAIP